MKPEKLTIERLEKETRMSTRQWHGKCTLLAHFACKLVGGNEIYGDYHGFIHPKGFWSGRGPFTHHGWVLLDDGRVLDPTRWSFENIEPYIYLDHNTKDYDEGSNRSRRMFRRPCPEMRGAPADLVAPKCVHALFEHLTGTPFAKMTREQACWVANLGYDELDFAVADIYETLINNDMSALIPIDNLKRARREGRVK